jgi:hypothetical protein
MTPAEKRRQVRVLAARCRRAMAKAAWHEARAKQEGEHTLDHWKWANHWLVKARDAAVELNLLTGGTGEPGAAVEDVR